MAAEARAKMLRVKVRICMLTNARPLMFCKNDTLEAVGYLAYML